MHAGSHTGTRPLSRERRGHTDVRGQGRPQRTVPAADDATASDVQGAFPAGTVLKPRLGPLVTQGQLLSSSRHFLEPVTAPVSPGCRADTALSAGIPARLPCLSAPPCVPVPGRPTDGDEGGGPTPRGHGRASPVPSAPGARRPPRVALFTAADGSARPAVTGGYSPTPRNAIISSAVSRLPCVLRRRPRHASHAASVPVGDACVASGRAAGQPAVPAGVSQPPEGAVSGCRPAPPAPLR